MRWLPLLRIRHAAGEHGRNLKQLGQGSTGGWSSGLLSSLERGWTLGRTHQSGFEGLGGSPGCAPVSGAFVNLYDSNFNTSGPQSILSFLRWPYELSTLQQQLLASFQQHALHTQAPLQYSVAPASSTSGPKIGSPLVPQSSSLPSPGVGGKIVEPGLGKASLGRIKQSPKKVNLVAAMVRGMRVEDAMHQMAVSTKRAAKTVATLIHAAAANGVQNHGLTKEKLVVAEAFVGKDKYLRRLNPHGRGKTGTKHRARCILQVIVKEMSKEQEERVERILTRPRWRQRQSRLRPHRLITVGRSRPEAAMPAENT